MKKLISFVAAAVLLIGALPSVTLAAEEYTVRDAYMYFAKTNPDFILKVLDEGFEDGVSEILVLDFLRAMQRSFYYDNLISPITEKNFEDKFFENMKAVSNADRFLGIQSALMSAFPEAVDYAEENRIHPDFQSLFDMVRDMVIERRMAERVDNRSYTLYLQDVAVPDPVSVRQLEAAGLPDSVRCLSESGLWVPMPVVWNGRPDTAYAGPSTVLGRIEAPPGYYAAEGFDGDVSLELNVEALSGGGSLAGGLSWSLEDGVLTVSGAGAMPDFDGPDDVPWAALRGAVNKVVVGGGVTYIGSGAFSGLENLASRSVEIPASVTAVGGGAFAGTRLDSAVLPSGLSGIGEGAFDGGVTLYGGLAGCAADRYAAENGLTFVPDDWDLPEVICLEAVRSDGGTVIEIKSMNTGAGGMFIAAYGGGMELMDTVRAEDGAAELSEPGVKYVRAFCWDENLRPLCKSKAVRLEA